MPTSNALSDYAENTMLSYIFAGGAFTSPTTVYLALCTAASDTGTTEVSYTGYARKAITFGAASGRAVTQSGTVTFDQCTAGSATATHYGIYDAVSSGNLLAWGALASSKAISAGNTPSVASGEVVLTFSNEELSTYLANAILDHIFVNTTYSAPANTYFGLSNATITMTDSGTVDSAITGSYARKIVTGWTVTTNSAANTSEETFATPTGTWGAITAVFVADNATLGAGNILFYDNSPTGDGQTPTTGDTVKFAAGAFSCSLD